MMLASATFGEISGISLRRGEILLRRTYRAYVVSKSGNDKQHEDPWQYSQDLGQNCRPSNDSLRLWGLLVVHDVLADGAVFVLNHGLSRCLGDFVRVNTPPWSGGESLLILLCWSAWKEVDKHAIYAHTTNCQSTVNYFFSRQLINNMKKFQAKMAIFQPK